MLIDGKEISKKILKEISSDLHQISKNLGRKPALSIILIGNNPASETYVKAKIKACSEVGIEGNLIRFDINVDSKTLIDQIEKLNKKIDIDGILLQLPVPKNLNERELIEHINPLKDVDGLTAENIGLLNSGTPRFIPATPYGIMEIFNRIGVSLSGKKVVIIGRSNIVGRPLFSLMSGRGENSNSTVTLCHSYTKNLSEFTLNADIIIAATGSANILDGSMIKEGAIIIDVGINRLDDKSRKSGYRLIGDVDFETANKKASYITPVPGGVGPMTITMLMKNVCNAAKRDK
ncbi:MAG: bifunctional 5,10-methylene-tetrahydrofolate dehydrogenase/5,10-methylene-tetrahydrofolate cyclohydrolase [Dehalococcoidia bacterium]|nr:bifunctional 5,10-methylene-tetrahydrofolate dehydrogenase/5,10-methylene-tetrahydrofolate cyclohydrolase [Dehalococcoidia bacterium]|tara:strand:+ start:7384 stop:8256 length:873 start_codon:yes stop_codon:yes gene_type:complete